MGKILEKLLEMNVRAFLEGAWPQLRPQLYEGIFNALKSQSDSGDKWAKLAIGEFYRDGVFVPQNLKRAEEIFLEQAKNRDYNAIVYLVTMYGDNDSPLFNREQQYIWASIASVYDKNFNELKKLIIMEEKYTSKKRLELDEIVSKIFEKSGA